MRTSVSAGPIFGERAQTLGRGRLLVGVPTGRERVCFDAHRVLDPQTTRDMFGSLELVSFSFVTDENRFVESATFEEARLAEHGCGLFEFRKP